MQPYFLPYVGYFSLIYNSEKFIFFDTPQFTKKSWYERNRIIKLTGGSTYIRVPLEKVILGTPINKITINNNNDWRGKLFSQLEIYKTAKYYSVIIPILKGVIYQDYDKLSTLNISLIMRILNYLDIKRDIFIYSDMNIDIEKVNSPDEWALNICKRIGASTYINSPGGREFFDPIKYESSKIHLRFIEQPLSSYEQIVDGFEVGLSIVDLLMHLSKHEIVEMLDKSTLSN